MRTANERGSTAMTYIGESTTSGGLYQAINDNFATSEVRLLRLTTITRWADLTFQNMELVGPPRFPEEARDFVRQIQSNLGLVAMENPFLDDNERLMPPEEYEARLRRCAPRLADPLHLGRLGRRHLAQA